MKITKRTVDAAAPTDRDRFVWDDELPGFGLRVWPSGRKTFLAQYRVGGGGRSKQRRFTIGTYPLLTAAALATERIKLGMCVTNPGTREPTVTASPSSSTGSRSASSMSRATARSGVT